eukprot:CAMPEP_0182937040 /NCGR_PEP_ID=MMETSP0105_2-20130417/41287_1 /TAXON_ID=81532 ORGANISM="Acanthoeca-like sp., Strain 10tr" /NCGR_SAMPLE_ID=MMETSP0105_2 /ASSEMBLY_ACC=CAM_ASM_000205 /LENGTH=130 /DNA_ID=CAMNT_0025076203 /DNA_START=88 /DNA_END=477 /DNA_ORIENTATION=+
MTTMPACRDQIEKAGIAAGNVTPGSLQEMLKVVVGDKLEAIEAKIDAAPMTVEPTVHDETEQALVSVSGLRTWKHTDGSYKSVPPGFKLPGRGNPVAVCWPLWLKGNVALGIRPYRDLTSSDFGIFKMTP